MRGPTALLATALPLLAGCAAPRPGQPASPPSTRPSPAAAPRPGPDGVVFGDARGARRIVFVVDASGMMITLLPAVKQELVKAMTELRSPNHSFNIIFFGDKRPFEAADANLIPATPENLRRVYQWLDDVAPNGRSDPVPAMRAALALRPDLVYLLGNDDFNSLDSWPTLRAAVAEANADGRARVNTIAYESSNPRAEDVLKGIAADSGGSYRHVGEADFINPPAR